VENVSSVNMVSCFIYFVVTAYSLSDERHICQRLNQFGHGKGTIYGGIKIYGYFAS